MSDDGGSIPAPSDGMPLDEASGISKGSEIGEGYEVKGDEVEVEESAKVEEECDQK